MDDRMRASDTDRDQVTARLREHYAEGRLTGDEMQERISAALGAKTLGDLRRLMTDLPEPWPARTQAVPAPVPGSWQAGPRRAYPAAGYLRRRPRLLPLMLLGFFFALIAGGGATGVAVKVAVLTSLAVLACFGLFAFTAARFLHRARRDWEHGHAGTRHWHHHHGGFGPPDRWSRW